tara:strand:- start:1397 stop:1525 length:129 start_codon:yes stop_codon:yes gene_type:complete
MRKILITGTAGFIVTNLIKIRSSLRLRYNTLIVALKNKGLIK